MIRTQALEPEEESLAIDLIIDKKNNPNKWIAANEAQLLKGSRKNRIASGSGTSPPAENKSESKPFPQVTLGFDTLLLSKSLMAIGLLEVILGNATNKTGLLEMVRILSL